MVNFRIGHRKNHKKHGASTAAAGTPLSAPTVHELPAATSPAAMASGRRQYQPPTPKQGSRGKMGNKADDQSTDKYAPVLSQQSSGASSIGDALGAEGTNSYYLSSTDADEDMSRSYNVMSASTGFSTGEGQRDGILMWNDSSEFYYTKQKYAYFSLIITALQVLVLMMQLALCGVAPLDVNPMVGPFPDAFSEWGGKNAYWIQQDLQLWRFVSPALLQVGVLHLLCNAVVQMETCAFFEREWGSFRWLLIYILSEVGCITCSCVASPDTIAVGSSGALMGLFGAKVAQVFSHTCFDNYTRPNEESIRVEHLSNVLCSLVVISVLSFVNYIDWSGHIGGLATGLVVGMWIFSMTIRSWCIRFLWSLLGLTLTIGGLGAGMYLFWTFVETDAELANVCEYFRNLFVEDYNCDCYWQ